MFHVIFDYFKFLHDFFLTFRTFTSRLSLLTFFRSKFLSTEEPGVKDQIIFVLQWWAEVGNGADFHSAKVFNEWRLLCECIGGVVGYEEIAKELSNYPPSVYERFKKDGPDKCKAPDVESPPVDFTSLDLSPLELARQITLMMESRILKIEPREFLKAAWIKKKEKAPNVVKLQEFLSHVQGWITAEILKYPKKEDRCILITLFIKTAKKFQEHNNFLGMLTIVSTLQKSLMKRLKLTWRLVDPKYKKELEKMDILLHPKSKFQKYHEALLAVPEGEPYLPIISITLDDIFKLNEILHDEVDDPPGWINWKKMRTTAKLIWEVIQPRPRYNFKECLPIQRFINKGEAWNNEKVCSRIAQIRDSQEEWESSISYENTCRLSSVSIMGLSDRDWKLLLAMGCELKTFEKGEKLVKQMQRDPFLFRIQKGEVKETKSKVEEDKNVISSLRTIKPGQIFGSFSIFSNFQDKLATSNIEVTSDALTAYQIPINKLLQLCESRPDLECKLYYTLAFSLARYLRKPPPGKLFPLRSSSRIINSDNDSKISEVFKLPEEEAILHQYRCKLIDTVTKHGGTLYVTARHFLFVGTVFGFKKQVRLKISEVASITANKRTIKIDDLLFGFGPTTFKPAFEFIKNMWKEAKKIHLQEEEEVEAQEPKSASLPTQNDWWSHLLEGSQSCTYKKGEVIVQRGQNMGGLYNISTGQCVIELEPNQERLFVDTNMEEDTIFGEVEFILGGTSPVTIKAAVDDTTVVKIESYFINILFQHQPHIAGRLYYQLGQVIYQRLLEANLV
eukprot:TRINITY_DN5332_c0_g1_i1.p1 TRINITY_DN5332_c0_g1~~TRINITY_DN5332_c0_g1_i1.p1  ORF type:complete len:919 (+),score=159.41 TRINITY_DN5332_c0_g1_i1:393-2759(+)